MFSVLNHGCLTNAEIAKKQKVLQVDATQQPLGLQVALEGLPDQCCLPSLPRLPYT